eukprot:GHUV01014465.1.p1 GENE.GHUV01014465.1~~GHUV01014465.1.p1  ORF type:complete len:654 (+),score=215.89 GHUV01014465.1:417-2378(+)
MAPAAPTAMPLVPIPVPVPVPAAPIGPPLPSNQQEARGMFIGLLAGLVEPVALEPIGAELSRIFQQSTSLSEEQLVEAFLEALVTVTFDPQHITAEQSVAPFLSVLPLLKDVPERDAQRSQAKQPTLRDKIKGKVIQKVLTHLNQKRAVTTDRKEFYLQAEAFAVLCAMDFVAVDGAVQTIEKLLKNSEKRAAAVTVLGKTVERCKDKVAAANPAMLASLFSVLDSITDKQFEYDIDWINNNMQRTRTPAAAPAPVAVPQPIPVAAAPLQAPPAAAPAGALSGIDRSRAKLHVTKTFQNPALGPGGTFFTLGWDPKALRLVSGGKEVPITVWEQDGTVHKTIDCSGTYVCCVDVETMNQLVLMCGIFEPPSPEGYKSRIAIYDGRPGQNYNQIGEIKRPEVEMTAVVRALPDTANIIAGETIRLMNNAYQEQIGLYDLNNTVKPGSTTSASPVATFNDHKQLVTCLTPLPGQTGVFVSGSRDFTVKIWDARTGPTAVATLGVPQGDFTATTHLEMVTCLDVAGDLLLSGSIDQSIAAWDLRAVGHTKPMAVAGATSIANYHGQQMQWQNGGILKASLDGSPIDKLAAVATVQGLFTVDFSTATPLINAAHAFDANGSNTPKQYSDIKWSSQTGWLYASAGDRAAVDLLEITQA